MWGGATKDSSSGDLKMRVLGAVTFVITGAEGEELLFACVYFL